jgi:hypothetical protein
MNPEQLDQDMDDEDPADEDIMVQASQIRPKRNKTRPNYLKDYVVPIRK